MGVLLSKIDNIKKLEEKSLSTRDKLFSTTLAISCPEQYNCHVNTGRPSQAALGWMGWHSNYKSMCSCQGPRISGGNDLAAKWPESCVLTQEAVQKEDLPSSHYGMIAPNRCNVCLKGTTWKMIKTSLPLAVHSGCGNTILFVLPTRIPDTAK